MQVVGLDRVGIGVVRRQAVEDREQRDTALPGAGQHLPRRLVGVARRGGDDDEQVGGLEQLGGEATVLGLDRIDVRGVDEDDAGAAALAAIGQDVEIAAAGEAGQDVATLERGDVVRRGEDHRTAGGGSQDARWARRPAGERVEEARLPGAGRADDHDDERRFQIRGAGNEVLGNVPVQPLGGSTLSGIGRTGGAVGQRSRELAEGRGDG